MIFPFLLSIVWESPLQPTWSTLDAIRTADRKTRFPAEASWSTVREAKTFGVTGESQYRYRISPDRDTAGYPRGSLIVESYLDGFPVWGVRSNGQDAPARPLGFVYAEDGFPTNAKVSLKTAIGWTTPPLNRRGIASLLVPLVLFENRHDRQKTPIDVPKPEGIWFKVAAQGYGTYSFYRDLTVVEPKGRRCRLEPTTREVIEDVLKGNWNDAPGTGPTP